MRTYKKQTGGRGKFADIQFEIGPADDEVVGLQFVNDIFGGSIPREFIPAEKASKKLWVPVSGRIYHGQHEGASV